MNLYQIQPQYEPDYLIPTSALLPTIRRLMSEARRDKMFNTPTHTVNAYNYMCREFICRLWAFGHEPYSLEVGQTYETLGGELVTIVGRNDEPGYETVVGHDGVYRYDRCHPLERGRVTGTHAFSDPRNIIPRTVA